MLGKYEWEVLTEMPREEYIRWLALARIEAREHDTARKKATRGKGGGRVVRRS